MKNMQWVILCCFLLALTEAARSRYRYNGDRYRKYRKQEKEEEVSKIGKGYADKEQIDPCSEITCSEGEECDLDENGEAMCQCIEECAKEEGPRVQVCSTQNVTFDNECVFYRMKCLCQTGDRRCDSNRYKYAHLNYYGQCTEIKPCEDHEMKEFPKRMHNWLFLIMKELDERQDLPPAAHDMVMEAKRHSKKWLLPVIWKFCDLDKTHDRLISTEELMPITAPLKPIEHCTGPFLEKCDSDNSGVISLEEWSMCLGLLPDEVEDRCDNLRQ